MLTYLLATNKYFLKERTERRNKKSIQGMMYLLTVPPEPESLGLSQTTFEMPKAETFAHGLQHTPPSKSLSKSCYILSL